MVFRCVAKSKTKFKVFFFTIVADIERNITYIQIRIIASTVTITSVGFKKFHFRVPEKVKKWS